MPPRQHAFLLRASLTIGMNTSLRETPLPTFLRGALAALSENMLYKYRIYSDDAHYVEHCDPYGFGMELRPGTASIIRRIDSFNFTDREWMENRDTGYNRPVNIYELHVGSWRRKEDGSWYTYTEIGRDARPVPERERVHPR